MINIDINPKDKEGNNNEVNIGSKRPSSLILLKL